MRLYRDFVSHAVGGALRATAMTLIACLGCADSTAGPGKKDSNGDASPSYGGHGGAGGAMSTGGAGGDLVPTCASAPAPDCPCGSRCEPDWTNAVAQAYGQCDPPCPHASCPPVPVGACGGYGVLVSGGDYYFYGAEGKLVGHERRDATITCEAFDPSFVPPTEPCVWVRHCGDVDLSKVRACSKGLPANDAGHDLDASTPTDAGRSMAAGDARAARDGGDRD